MAVATQPADLWLNGLDVMMSTPDPTYGYQITIVDGETDFGNPDAVIADIQSQLQDGDLQRIDRYGNRTAVLDFRIKPAPGLDSPGAAVAAGQRALELACGFTGWAELAWTSPMAGADTSVMEMTSAVVGKTLATAREMSDGTRIVKVTIGARPFVRPTTLDTFTAPAVTGSTTTSVDSGSSTTGWSMLSTTPVATTNLETDPNINGVNSWTNGTGASSVTYDSTSGNLFVSRTAAGTTAVFANSPKYTVVGGRFYRFGWTAGATGYTSPQVRVRWFSDTSGTVQIGSDQVYNGSSSVLDTESPTLTAPANAVRAQFFPSIVMGIGTYAISRRWVTESTSSAGMMTGYFDGSTTATAARAFAWTGTANASTSTATWTAPALAVVSGTVQGTVYGRSSASIRRTGAITMSTLPYLRIRGTASAYSDGIIQIVDNGAKVADVYGGAVSYSYNALTGVYDILIYRPGGFTTVDVTFSRAAGTISPTAAMFVNVDQIDITDNPFASGKVQTRQISIGGSQRTELSLSVLGLDAAGTTPVPLGDQVLIHTAAAGTDPRAKFLSCRTASGLGGTADSSATGGVNSNVATLPSTTTFTFPASSLLPGNYLLVARLWMGILGTRTISFRGYVDPTTGDNAYDPPGGTAWKTIPLTTTAAGGYPVLKQSTYGMLPLGVLRLPPADVQDSGATLNIQIAADSSGVTLDDIWLLNADIGQTTLVNTAIAGPSSYSSVQLNAATVDTPNPTVWFGVANSTSITDPTRLLGFEQHQAKPGLMQVSSVTPNCATSRLAGFYYRRYGHDVAPAT